MKYFERKAWISVIMKTPGAALLDLKEETGAAGEEISRFYRGSRRSEINSMLPVKPGLRGKKTP
jgi:hypothetical protein